MQKREIHRLRRITIPAALIGAGLALSSCTTRDVERLLYNTGKNMCDRSAYHCDGGYRTGEEWRHPGGTTPKPNLPKDTPGY